MSDLQQSRSEKPIVALVLLSAFVLLTGGTLLNVRFGHNARQLLRDQFNEQQLVVARSVRHWIESRLDALRKELLLAAETLKDADDSQEGLALILKPCFDRVTEIGVRKIELWDRNRHLILACYPSNLPAVALSEKTPQVAASAIPSEAGDAVALSEPIVDGAEIYLNLNVTPDHPVFETLSFQLNISWFLSPFIKSIRSGTTGYAWIIDSQGRFLFHPQRTFIGQSAFEARQIRDPDISYHQINTIQQERMLKGMEGTGVYTSTWHRGFTGEIEKLIAYTPVTISGTSTRTWSVAVVAPVFEIENALKKIHRWQAVLQAMMVLVILAAGGIVLWFEIRCTSIPENILESELFGHVKGAFTGAWQDKKGLVEEAHEGTLFLDEIGDLSPMLQTKLLRLLQEGEYKPLGSVTTRNADLRFIAATNHDLKAEIESKHFREDLYYRLNVIRFELPPLKARREDIRLLACHFLEKYARLNRKNIRKISPGVFQTLMALDFPGNVRELENIIERGVIFCRSDTLTPADLFLEVPGKPVAGADTADMSTLTFKAAKERMLEDFHRRYVEIMLRENGGNVSRAAEKAGIQRQYFHRLMKESGVSADAFKPGSK